MRTAQGVANVLEQLQQVARFAAQTDALRNGHEETIRRVQRLEQKENNSSIRFIPSHWLRLTLR